MKKIQLLLFLFNLLFNSSFAQQVTFEKNYHINGFDHGVSAIELSNNRYMLFCSTRKITPSIAYLSLINIDSNGDTIWQKDFCGHYSRKMYLLKDSNLIMLSSTYCYNGFNYELTKLNLNGDTLWTKQYSNWLSDYAFCLDVTADNGFLIACSVTPQVFKTDSNGTWLWSKGLIMSEVYGVKETLDKGFIVAGLAIQYINSWAIEKYDSTGAYEWGKGYGDNQTGDPDSRFRDVAVLPDSDFIVGGSYPFCLSKVNHLNGDTIWNRNVSYGFWTNSVSVTNDGNIIIAGDSKIAKYDTAGNQLWIKTFPGTDLMEIKTTLDGGFIASGDYYPNFSQPNFTALLIRLDSLGNVTNFIGMNELSEKFNGSFVYPNPINETSVLQFNNKMNDVFVLAVADVQGRLIETTTVSGNSAPVSNNNKHSGVYFYTLCNKRTGEMMKGKFISP